MPRHFFILGMPRCRTAWLSVLLTHGNVHCFHEGTNGCATLEDYFAKLREHPADVVGDANPSLVFHIDRLIAEFPDAKFMMAWRDAGDALAALLAAAPEADRAGLINGWPAYIEAYQHAFTRLSNERPEFQHIHVNDFDYWPAGIISFISLTGEAVDLDRYDALLKLRITTTFPPVTAMPAVERERKPVTMQPLGAIRRCDEAGICTTGFTVEEYTDGHRRPVEGWFTQHRDEPFPAANLPPLGVVVSYAGEQIAALWCFETYGTGVAWIEFPVTRPHLTARRASEALAFAVCALIELAGKGYEPEAVFTRFRICCPPAMTPTLQKLGFLKAEQRDNLILTL